MEADEFIMGYFMVFGNKVAARLQLSEPQITQINGFRG
jgi:hypothetical protein